jgi:3'-phosphoadenosine 5'-phosphosulfate sulfotransferase (PAPS reductase)/FAD synthetase
VAFTPEIESALNRKAPVCIGVSAGKDSQAMAYWLCDYLDNRGHVGQRLLIHSDLGRAEWRQSLPVCERLAARLGVELVLVRRQAGDMMDRWLRLQTGDPRFEDRVDASAGRNGRAPGGKVRTDG